MLSSRSTQSLANIIKQFCTIIKLILLAESDWFTWLKTLLHLYRTLQMYCEVQITNYSYHTFQNTKHNLKQSRKQSTLIGWFLHKNLPYSVILYTTPPYSHVNCLPLATLHYQHWSSINLFVQKWLLLSLLPCPNANSSLPDPWACGSWTWNQFKLSQSICLHFGLSSALPILTKLIFPQISRTLLSNVLRQHADPAENLRQSSWMTISKCWSNY